MTGAVNPRPSAYWLRRLAAYIADAVLIFAVSVPLVLLLAPLLSGAVSAFVRFLGELLYFAWMTADGHCATYGQRLLGLRVERTDGRSPGLDRAYWRAGLQMLLLALIHTLPLPFPPDEESFRHAAETGDSTVLAASLTALAALGVWYLPAVFTAQALTLHDRLTGTRVVPAPGRERLFG